MLGKVEKIAYASMVYKISVEDPYKNPAKKEKQPMVRKERAGLIF